jgi:hypothetical protein
MQDLLAELEAKASQLAAQAPASAPTEEIVNLGHALTSLVKQANEALGPLKVRLRELALTDSQGKPGPYYYPGEDGKRCVVVIPKQTVSVRNDADMAAVQDDLGARFSAYFDTKTTYTARKDFHNTVSSNPTEAAKVLPLIDIKDSTPRVSFR